MVFTTNFLFVGLSRSDFLLQSVGNCGRILIRGSCDQMCIANRSLLAVWRLHQKAEGLSPGDQLEGCCADLGKTWWRGTRECHEGGGEG